MAALPGFEPRLTDPKSVVLPLHYRALFLFLTRHRNCAYNLFTIWVHAHYFYLSIVRNIYRTFMLAFSHAAPPGFEPRMSDSESLVLPITPKGTNAVHHSACSRNPKSLPITRLGLWVIVLRADDGPRTRNILLGRQILYQIELHPHCCHLLLTQKRDHLD